MISDVVTNSPDGSSFRTIQYMIEIWHRQQSKYNHTGTAKIDYCQNESVKFEASKFQLERLCNVKKSLPGKSNWNNSKYVKIVNYSWCLQSSNGLNGKRKLIPSKQSLKKWSIIVDG